MEATKDLKFIYTFWQANKGPVTSVKESNSNEIFSAFQKLSFLLLKKYHPAVPIKLKTNTAGWNTISHLDLPWDEVDISLDKYNNLDQEHWAYVKVCSMFEEEPPFIHLDFDVLLESNILSTIKDYKVLYQSPEALSGNSFYEPFVKKYGNTTYKSFLAYNAGFVYINTDIGKIRERIKTYFEDYEIANENAFAFGIGFEQVVIPSILKKENGKYFATLVKAVNRNLIDKNKKPSGNDIPAIKYRHYVAGRKTTQLQEIKKELLELEKSHVAA